MIKYRKTIPEQFILETNQRGRNWTANEYYITAGQEDILAEASISLDVEILSSSGISFILSY
jgi:hypothetical protein